MALHTLEFCYPFMRYSLFFFNLIFWLCGIILFGFSIWALVGNFDHLGAWSSYIQSAAVLVLLTSLVIAGLGFLGCVGAIKESKCMLLTFIISLLIIFGILLACGVAVLYKKDTIKDIADKRFRIEMNAYRIHGDAARNLTFLGPIQKGFGCCGLTEETCKDFSPQKVPDSCDMSIGCERFKPCMEKMEKYFKKNMHIFGAVVVTITIIMILGMIFALCVFCGIRELEQSTYEK